MRAEFIEKGEFVRMLKDMREDCKLVMLVSLETGLRVSDVLGLTYAQALLHAPITERKTKKTCTIDLPSYLDSAISARWARSSCQASALVFPSDRDTRKPLHRSTVYRAVKRAFDDCGANVTPHTARKIYAVELYRQTGRIEEVQRRLRHDSPETTLLYIFSDRLQHFSESCK